MDYWNEAYPALALIGAALLVGALAGSYPAFSLSGFQPVAVLKGRFTTSARGTQIRQGLVVFQFVISTVLIAGTVVVYRQLEFVRNKNLGITKDQIVVLPYSPAAEAMTNAFLQHPRVKKVSVSQRVPVNTVNSDTRTIRLEGNETPFSVHSYVIDEHFLATYDIPLLAGRMLDKNFPEGETPFLLNETAVRQLGWRSNEEALGKRMQWSGTFKSGRIVGVVRDFHLASLHEEIAPMVLTTIPEDQWWRTFISVRVGSEGLNTTLTFLEATWRQFTPDGAFEHFFIDGSFAQLHRADQRMGEMIGYFAALSIAIACLGLFGLAAFASQQRTKEIGIRKVLGASVAGIVGLMSKDFVKLVLVANLISWPLAYFAMNRWLQDFAYHIDIGIGIFLLSGALALAIALLTVSFQAIKAALANPVEALRYE
jgi:putative ABC transport system permease protein